MKKTKKLKQIHKNTIALSLLMLCAPSFSIIRNGGLRIFSFFARFLVKKKKMHKLRKVC